jgi:hypothetical protein
MKIQNKLFFALSFIFLFFSYSCKKEKSPDPATPAANQTISGYDGILTAALSQNIYNGALMPYPAAMGDAWFGNTPSTAYAVQNFVMVDSVSLNGTYFKFGTFYYRDTTYSIPNLPPVKWRIAGAHGIPSFTYVNTTTMPVYTGYASLPDSINHTQNLSIPLTGISNANVVSVSIIDSLGHSVFANNITTASIAASYTVANLSTLVPCTYGYLTVCVRNENPQAIAGKNFRFDNAYQVTNFIKIK